MITRDALLTAVAIVAIAAFAWLSHDGVDAAVTAPLLVTVGACIGRFSGANTPTPDPAVPAAIDVDAYEAH